MATSLETRAPFLDHRVAAVAWRLPLALKIHGRTGKWALRQILARHVPPSLTERPKAGFAIPLGPWLRGPLRSWAEDLLDPGLLRRQGFLRPEPIIRLWHEHRSGRADHTPRLWTVLMWQAWLAEWGGGR
jgi:asparagine synthase (glutamine-hydrolysing)